MRVNKIILKCLLVISGNCFLTNAALAQDSAFLACAQFSDRGQRIACLEDALEAAVDAGRVEMAEEAPRAAPAAPPVHTPPQSATPQVSERPAAEPAPPAPSSVSEPAEDDPSLLDRLRNFGRQEQPTIAVDEAGNDELHDTIAALEKRRGLWIVTLGSGQVWRQQVPRTMNLREGDEVRIYRAGIGNGYRLAAERLSGFIRVERVD